LDVEELDDGQVSPIRVREGLRMCSGLLAN
jgi:hypothetical protein